jgi:hypothetical protein
MTKCTLKTVFLASIAAFSSLFVTSIASAQMEYVTEAMQPAYFSRDLVIFAEGLNLDDTQEVIVEAMFDAYEDDFQLGWATTQERLNTVAEEMKDKPPLTSIDTLEPVLNTLGDWLIEKRQLDQGLLENVQAILVSEQRVLWPIFARRLYREKHMNRGRLSGESVDLFVISRDCDLSPVAESSISDTLDEYAVALDIAMRKRDAILRGNPNKLFENILSGNDKRDPKHMEDLIKARIETRDINDRYTEIISSELAPVDSENFRTRSLKRGYARIYRRTPAQRIFRQAAENPSYSPEISAQIYALEGVYLQKLASINFELLELTRKHEPAVQLHREQAGQIRKNGGTSQKLDDPTREIFKKREILGEEYIAMLRALLSAEQFLELDGSRRWIPREEQKTLPNTAVGTGQNGLTLKNAGEGSANPSPKGKGKDDKNSKPDNSGFGNKGKPGS